ncbi:hypothetical protein VTG60DRAFT_6522 [Thermothelomyces hinnuleus]
MSSLPKTFKKASFKQYGGRLIIEEAPLQPPSKNEILVKVEACGVCHSDVYAQINGYGAGLPSPLDKVNEAFDAMLSGKVRFKAVITFD